MTSDLNPSDFNLERRLKIFDDKLKDFLTSINRFIVITLFFFLLIFLPYVTLVGNTVDQRLKDRVGSQPIPLTNREEQCHYDLTALSVNWLQKHKGGNSINNDLEKQRLEKERDAIEKRIEALKFPLVDKVPASIGEVILFSPAVISLYLALLLIQFNELMQINKGLSDVSIPYTRIIILFSVGFLVYLYTILILNFNTFVSRTNCSLYKIIKAQILYQQHDVFYNIINCISSLFLLLAFINIILPEFIAGIFKKFRKTRTTRQ